MARTARQRTVSHDAAVPGSPSNEHASQQKVKQHERIIKDAYTRQRKLESYLADDENFPSFAIQLAKIDLELRDIPGDGNCLFRALGDQIEGHGRNHYKHRCQVVNFMLEHRADFEPFVESDVPFVQYLQQLQKLGTYAGNDAIMAFARLHSVDVVIHQLNAPLLLIHGSDSHDPKQIHLAYHNGDHYSSIRVVNDNTESPTHIQISDKSSFGKSAYSHVNGHDVCSQALEDHVMRLSGCNDRDAARQALLDNELDAETAIADLMQHMEITQMANHSDSANHSGDTDSGIWSENGTGSRIFGGGVDTQGGARPKHASKKERKQEKQLRSVERHRQLIAAGGQAHAPHT